MRRSIVQVGVVTFALLLGAAAMPERSEGAGIKDAIDDAICTFVQSNAGENAGRKIIQRLSRSRIRANGAVMSVAIWSAQQFCSAAIPRVTSALSAAFGSQGSPTNSPTNADVDVILRRIRADGVAADLRVAGINATRASVQRSAGNMCRGLRQGTDAASVGRQLAGRYRVRALAGLSGVVGLMKNCSSAPAAWQVDSLSGALATTLVANTYPRDVEPPIVALGTLRTARASDGRTEITLDWFAFDFSGAVTSEPWLWYRGAWERLPLNLNRADAVRVWLPPGESYLFAVRATDANRNTSAFAYSATFRS